MIYEFAMDPLASDDGQSVALGPQKVALEPNHVRRAR